MQKHPWCRDEGHDDRWCSTCDILWDGTEYGEGRYDELCTEVRKMLRAYYRARDRADQHHYTRHGAQDYWKLFTERRQRVEQLTLK